MKLDHVSNFEILFSAIFLRFWRTLTWVTSNVLEEDFNLESCQKKNKSNYCSGSVSAQCHSMAMTSTFVKTTLKNCAEQILEEGLVNTASGQTI